MSDEERYLDAKDRPTLDPHDVAATMADDQRMAEEGLSSEQERAIADVRLLADYAHKSQDACIDVLAACKAAELILNNGTFLPIRTFIQHIREHAAKGVHR